MTDAGRAAAARASRALARRQARNLQTIIVILLIAAVFALGAVFVWVVLGDRNGEANAAAPAASSMLIKTQRDLAFSRRVVSRFHAEADA